MAEVIKHASDIVAKHGGIVCSLTIDAGAGMVNASMAQRGKGLLAYICVCHAIQLAMERITLFPTIAEAYDIASLSKAFKPRNVTRWWSLLASLQRVFKWEKKCAAEADDAPEMARMHTAVDSCCHGGVAHRASQLGVAIIILDE